MLLELDRSVGAIAFADTRTFLQPLNTRQYILCHARAEKRLSKERQCSLPYMYVENNKVYFILPSFLSISWFSYTVFSTIIMIEMLSTHSLALSRVTHLVFDDNVMWSVNTLPLQPSRSF